MNELAAQKDEILAIKSIFESDDLMLDEDCRRGVFLASPVIPNPPLTITYSGSYKKQTGDCLGPARKFINDKCIGTLQVNYLPPLEFRFELPDKYPSTCPPRFLISCDWLGPADVSKICEHLDHLWLETKGEILYLWFDFLLHDLISFLEIQSNLDITELQRSSEPCSPSRSKHLSNANGCKFYDKRATTIYLGDQLLDRIKQYDVARKKESFSNSKIDCEICFMSFFGSETVSLGCDHYFCESCIKTYLETCIADGQVYSLVCPADDCDASAQPELVKALVKPDLYRKYDSILLSSAIGKFDGVIYCPRKFCLKPIITEQQNPDTNKLILCPYCDFAFCSSCKSSYHGVSPCKDFADEKEKEFVLREYETGSAEQKRSLEKLYGKQFLTQQLTEFMSRLWLKEKSKQCPNCFFSIEKIDGCNKIHCFRCNANFCWLCLSKLRSDFPYLHFRDTKSPCYAKLFEGVIQDEIEDGDDEEWEEMDELFIQNLVQ
ncbi:E3 ubiquitin-protein ligase RNF14 [Tetranychus urticae]|uniref:RBR-type E3 ubiquitin transferase n=1 Tax=Tetranychus urticae TaxID=32264 RepID=T1KXQ3_TETUR|nr:E3 ubiquitin-protein ligase RNF14 [Tetranychus urticae]